METGEVIRTKSIKALTGYPGDNMRVETGFKPAPGREMVFLFLGTRDAMSAEPFDAIKQLESWGWVRKPEFQKQIDEAKRHESL